MLGCSNGENGLCYMCEDCGGEVLLLEAEDIQTLIDDCQHPGFTSPDDCDLCVPLSFLINGEDDGELSMG